MPRSNAYDRATSDMHIHLISPFEIGGGAERVAKNLFDAYRALGHTSRLYVGWRQSNDPDVIELTRNPGRETKTSRLWDWHLRLAEKQPATPASEWLSRWTRALALGRTEVGLELGLEDFSLRSSQLLLAPPDRQPDVVHGHNLHGFSFDLRLLPALSRQAALFLTLHDDWLLTGHCASSMGCDRWQQGCGRCPDLNIYPAVRRDATRVNWQRKKRIYGASRLHLIVPSEWLAARVRRSLLSQAELRVIHNGIDLSVYKPGSQAEARQELDLPANAIILLFAAQYARHNPFKDWPLMRRALESFPAETGGQLPVILNILGDDGPAEYVNRIEVRPIAFSTDLERVARIYQAADIFLYASRADNYPTTIMEAMACGLPVVATAVGGIVEQVSEADTGYLTPPGDALALAAKLMALVDDAVARRAMGARAARYAQTHFGLSDQVSAHLAFYREVLSRRN
jgi:glycosyltransferase involved in cell wall biosynthesis